MLSFQGTSKRPLLDMPFDTLIFKECNVGLRKNESSKTYDAVFMRYGEIVGYVMPIARVEDWD